MSERARGPGPGNEEQVAVSEFKSRCLELIERTRTTGARYVVTKHGKPVALVTPVAGAGRSLRGAYAGEITIHGDIVNTDFADEWEALK